VLAEKGGAGLLQALLQIKPRVGYVRSSRLPTWEVQFAQSSPLPDGGRRIVLATDRPLTDAERARHNRRTSTSSCWSRSGWTNRLINVEVFTPKPKP